MSDEKKFTRNIKVTQKEYKPNLQHNVIQGQSKLAKAGESFLKFYLLFDLFGMPITLRYKGNDNFRSAVGATLSLSVLGCIVLFFGYSAIVFLGRQSPVFSIMSTNNPIPDPINLNNFSLPLDWTVGFDVFDKHGKTSMFSTKFFSFDVKKMVKSGGQIDESKNEKVINVPCSSSYAFNQNVTGQAKMFIKDNSTTYYDYFKMKSKETGEETANCFLLNIFNDTERNINVSNILSGTDATENAEFISISLRICNKAENDDCLPTEDISKYISDLSVRLYITQQAFVANETLKTPVVNSTVLFTFKIQQYFSKTIDLFLQKNEVRDSWNILSTKSTYTDLFSYSSNKELGIDFVEKGVDITKELLVINLKADPVSISFERKFPNIKDFFINIIGILNGIWAGGMGLGKFFNSLLLKVDMINQSFFLIENPPTNELREVPNFNSEKPKIQELVPIKNKESKPDDNRSIDKTDRNLIKEEEKTKIKQDHENSFGLDQKPQKDLLEGGTAGKLTNPYYNDDRLVLPTKTKKFKRFKMDFGELLLKLLPCRSKNLTIKKKIFEDCGQIIESYFEIERIVAVLMEYPDFRNVVLSQDEYVILKQLTTPQIEIIDEEVKIKKAEKAAKDEKQLMKNYSSFIQFINKLIKTPYLSPIESNLLEIHRIGHLSKG
jgi:hypothetical protein